MNAGAQSADAFIENNGREKPDFSGFARLLPIRQLLLE
jgi:hypothetical protein